MTDDQTDKAREQARHLRSRDQSIKTISHIMEIPVRGVIYLLFADEVTVTNYFKDV